MKYDHNFLKQMPKTDLHLHLDGSIRIESLVQMSKLTGTKLPSLDPGALKELVFLDKYKNLAEYLQGFAYTCDVLRDMENLEQASYELAIDNQKENTLYIEVRFAPQLLVDLSRGIDFEKVISSVNKGLNRAKLEYNQKIGKDQLHFDYGIICCAMRNFGPKGYSPYYTNLYNMFNSTPSKDIIRTAAMEVSYQAVRLRDKGIPVVGIDLAGEESGFPASDFKAAYKYAHKQFMGKTVHAGEAYGAESIFQAITDCYADRIGHGYSLFIPELVTHPKISEKQKFVDNLSSFVADKRITIEVCLTSNMQTNPSIGAIQNHQFKNMLESRLATSICTDNRLISRTTVTDEYIKATENFTIPLKRLKDIVAYGFKKSFFPGSYVEKRAYAKKAMHEFDKVKDKFSLKN